MGRNEHVWAIERMIWTIKERIWAKVNQLPFKVFPHRLIVEMVYNVTFWLNAFPHNDGLHDVMSPRTILAGLHINHNKHCTLEFGSYVQIHKEHDNSMTSRTSGAIALRPTGNTQGTHYFLNINSGRRVARNHWTALLMPNEIIQVVHRLAAANKKHKGIVLTDENSNIINDNSPEEPDKTEITGVRTGVGNINNTESNTDTERNVVNTETNNTAEINNNYNSTFEDEEVSTQDNTQDTSEVCETYGTKTHETHSTQEDEQETYDEELMVHDEQTIEVMNMANL